MSDPTEISDTFDARDEITVEGEPVGTLGDWLDKARPAPTEQDSLDLLRRTFPGLTP